MLAPPSVVELRAQLVTLVECDLLGPAGGEIEVLPREEQPRDRYLLGMLAPTGHTLEVDLDEALGSGDESEEDGDAEPEAARESLFPSSLGLSFRVDGACDELRVRASWGRYERVAAEDGEGRVWQRVPCGGELTLGLVEGRQVVGSPDSDVPDVRVEAVVRPFEGQWSVTLFLRNGQAEPEELIDSAWLFQARLAVEAPDGAAVFAGRPDDLHPPDREDQLLAVGYRHRVEHAVGHNVAVHTTTAVEDPTRAVRLETTSFPQFEVAQMRPPAAEDEPLLAPLELDMERLGAATDGELVTLLEPLATAYADWLVRQGDRLRDGTDDLAPHIEAGGQLLERAEEARRRISEGIELLRESQQARDAFRLANRAMALQRSHTLWSEHKRRGGTEPLSAFGRPEDHSWYPFQLAFVLLNLPSVTDPTHPDRSHPTEAICDLLWYPTGGGKTEAYLGLSAYVLWLRRLQGPLGGRRADAGVAVLMRYTLRVLTLQQFQRAASLVCACEVLRREDVDRWGEEPFRIGLWVGQATTPNRIDMAAEALKNLHGDSWRKTGSGRPDQLSSCPWCGERIDPAVHMKVETYEKGRARVLTYCGDKLGACEFSQRKSPGEGIPVLTVDEEIFRRLPAMVIATVDKFAQLPWNGATETLFGVVEGRCERHGFRTPTLEDVDSHPVKGSHPTAKTVDRGLLLRPPDLIIQDELHLISGPLGTMVGLYETAIDRLASWELDGKPVRPKVIASTATVRRAGDQVHRLFLRRVRVFPPPGLDVTDNFFARQRPLDEAFGRLYIGVCAPGRRLKAVLIRTYVAFLAAAQVLYERYDTHADPWMTLVGYFNAMQELAGMRRLCEDDIRTRLGKTDRRGLAQRRLGPESIQELTSRLAGTEIPEKLDAMERTFSRDEEEKRRRRDRSASPRPIDVLLATNMISVGVDVRRLGLMVVAGQPKTTAEYIQATSRVGRSTPGIVCTVYNWARPRDLSHYERFEHYHSSFYRFVEALSVTPFASRARDRGLSALLVSLVRDAELLMNPNAAAQQLDRTSALVAEAVEAIRSRAGEVEMDAQLAQLVEGELDWRLDWWLARVQQVVKTGAKLGYQEKRDSDTVGLLRRPSTDPWDTFTALNSLRDVEPTVGLILSDGALFPGADGGSGGSDGG
jgi:Helicase conserved C-terminal domain